MFWLTGKLGRAGVVHGSCVLPGLVRLVLGVGSGLDVDGGEVVGVVSCEMKIYSGYDAWPSLPINQDTNPTPPNTGPVQLHHTAATLYQQQPNSSKQLKNVLFF